MGVSLLQCHTHVTVADLPEGDPEPYLALVEAATTILGATKAIPSTPWNPPRPAALPHHHLARSFPWQGPFVCRAGPTGGFLQHCGAVAPFGCRRRLGREARGLCSTSSGAWSVPLVRSPSRAFVVPPTLAPLGLFAGCARVIALLAGEPARSRDRAARRDHGTPFAPARGQRSASRRPPYLPPARRVPVRFGPCLPRRVYRGGGRGLRVPVRSARCHGRHCGRKTGGGQRPGQVSSSSPLPGAAAFLAARLGTLRLFRMAQARRATTGRSRPGPVLGQPRARRSAKPA